MLDLPLAIALRAVEAQRRSVERGGSLSAGSAFKTITSRREEGLGTTGDGARLPATFRSKGRVSLGRLDGAYGVEQGSLTLIRRGQLGNRSSTHRVVSSTRWTGLLATVARAFGLGGDPNSRSAEDDGAAPILHEARNLRDYWADR